MDPYCGLNKFSLSISLNLNPILLPIVISAMDLATPPNLTVDAEIISP